MTAALFCCFTVDTEAAVTTKKQKSYDIAIAFDNSGSMYTGGNKAWCRAVYAMEIFASMLDYDNGDRLRIYPMWEVTTDGSTPSPSGGAEESHEPIIVSSRADVDKISNIYTIYASGTPFTPVEKAYEYLKDSDASEKWLIILSDGSFNEKEPDVGVRERFLEIAKDGVKVQYLGFSGADDIAPDVSKGFYSKMSTDASLMDDLVAICNLIFQRSVLPTEYYDNGELNIDLSMRKVIVFIQGQGAKVNSLKSPEGRNITPLQTSGQRKYSELGTGGHIQGNDFSFDDTLFGEVVAFGECPKGVYTLDCTGAEAVQIFYEPDVDIKVSLTDDGGNSVDASSEGIEAGEYMMSSCIVDSVTGEDVTNHVLMGNDVSLVTYVRPSGASFATEYENGAKIVFKPDDETEVVVEATYLKDYTISTRDDPSAFPLPLKVKDPTVDFEVELKQVEKGYKLAGCSDWKPIKAVLSVAGRPLTADEMKNTSVSFPADNAVSVKAEMLADESAYNLYIGKDENGNTSISETGEFNLCADFTFIDEYGKQVTYSADATVNVSCELDITATVEQSQSWYVLRDHENWQPIRLQLTLDGEPLTEEQLRQVEIIVEFNEDISYRCELSPSDSSYYVYVGSDDDGNFVSPSSGKYKIEVSAKYADSQGNGIAEDGDSDSFEIQKYSKFWRWLVWLIIIILIIASIIAILNHPTMPSSVYLKIKHTCQLVKINGTSVALSTDLYPGEIKCEAKAYSPFKNRGKTTAAFEVKNIKAVGSVEWFELDGTRFKKTGGKYLNDDGETIDKMKLRVIISDDTELKWKTSRHTVTGRIFINHND